MAGVDQLYYGVHLFIYSEWSQEIGKGDENSVGCHGSYLIKSIELNQTITYIGIMLREFGAGKSIDMSRNKPVQGRRRRIPPIERETL